MIIVPCGETGGAKARCLPYLHIPFPFLHDGPLLPALPGSVFHGWKILGFVHDDGWKIYPARRRKELLAHKEMEIHLEREIRDD